MTISKKDIIFIKSLKEGGSAPFEGTDETDDWVSPTDWEFISSIIDYARLSYSNIRTRANKISDFKRYVVGHNLLEDPEMAFLIRDLDLYSQIQQEKESGKESVIDSEKYPFIWKRE